MFQYVPTLKSKRNDIDAVVRVSSTARKWIKPLIEAPLSIEGKETRTDVAQAADIVIDRMPDMPFYFDPLDIEAEFRQLSAIERIAQQGKAVSPTFGLHRLPANTASLKSILHSHELTFAIRVELQDIDDSPEESWAAIIDYSARLEVAPEMLELILELHHVSANNARRIRDLVLDFVAMQPRNFVPASIALIASSALSSVAGIDLDGYAQVDRVERDIWADINFELAGTRLVKFGDYGVLNPNFVFSGANPNANAKIRYTQGPAHHVFRGHGLYKPARFEQYHDLAKRVVDSNYFLGEDFSYGSQYIASCASGECGPGNLATWIKVDTNHHMEVVSRQTRHIISNLGSVTNATALQDLLVSA